MIDREKLNKELDSLMKERNALFEKKFSSTLSKEEEKKLEFLTKMKNWIRFWKRFIKIMFDSVKLQKKQERNIYIPTKVFFTKGRGEHEDEVMSFEYALRDAGVEGQNFVCVSSILPKECEIISKEEGVSYLLPGAVTHCVMSRQTLSPSRTKKDTEDKKHFASVSCIRYKDNSSDHGYIFEHHGFASDAEIERRLDIWTRELFFSKFKEEKEIDFRTNIQTGQPHKDKFVTLLAMAIFI